VVLQVDVLDPEEGSSSCPLTSFNFNPSVTHPAKMESLGSDLPHLRVNTLVGLAVTIAIVWWSVSQFRTWYRLRHIPGPSLASVSSLWIVRYLLRGGIASGLQGLQKYGRLVRVGPNYLLTDDPDILRQISSARSEYNRDTWWESLNMTTGHSNLATILEIGPHDKTKAKMAAAYSGRDNMDMEKRVESKILHLKDVIRQRYLSEGEQVNTVDLSRLTYYFTLDVITDLAYGEEFGFLNAEGDLYNYTQSLDKLLRITGLVSEIPLLRKVVNSSVVGAFLRPKFSDKSGLGRLMGYVTTMPTYLSTHASSRVYLTELAAESLVISSRSDMRVAR
jgi:hypothetical protein